MEAAARPSGHKRNFSAYDTQLASFDPSGKAARPSEEPAPGAEQEQPEEQPLTESAQFNLEALRTSQEEVIRQIDELQEVGLAFLDRMRASFLDRIATFKQELSQAMNNVAEAVHNTSALTLEGQGRVVAANQLVQRLNIKTQDEAAPDLFSAEQEGEAAEAPGAE